MHTNEASSLSQVEEFKSTWLHITPRSIASLATISANQASSHAYFNACSNHKRKGNVVSTTSKYAITTAVMQCTTPTIYFVSIIIQTNMHSLTTVCKSTRVDGRRSWNVCCVCLWGGLICVRVLESCLV